MTNPSDPARHFVRQHEHLDAQLQAHLLDVVGGDFASARQRLEQWRAALAQHIAVENTQLLPHVPEGARWAAKVYLLEHERIALLAEEYADRLQAVIDQPPHDAQVQRRASLFLLDAAHALRHVLEHHHMREETALAEELPQTLQAAVWGAAPHGFP